MLYIHKILEKYIHVIYLYQVKMAFEWQNQLRKIYLPRDSPIMAAGANFRPAGVSDDDDNSEDDDLMIDLKEQKQSYKRADLIKNNTTKDYPGYMVRLH